MRRNIWVVAFACAATLAGPALATGAQAAPTASAAAVGADAGSTQVPVFNARTRTGGSMRPADAAAVITEYWTSARRAKALPAKLGVVGPESAKATATESEGTRRDLAAPVAAKQVGPRLAVAFTHTDGKVFFRDPRDGLDYVCSAGAVNSGKRRLVLTAGHCVHGGRGGQWMQNWVFYPGYQNGPGPAGAFPAYQLWTKTAWTNDSNYGYDYAIAITQTNGRGQRVVDRVGGNGLTVNPGRPYVTFIGYPWNVGNGEVQAFCQGQLSARSIFNRDQQLNCNIGGGGSGGPWIRDYSDATGLGYIVSNTSYGTNPDPQGPVYGPYYDSATTSLYNSAETASP